MEFLSCLQYPFVECLDKINIGCEYILIAGTERKFTEPLFSPLTEEIGEGVENAILVEYGMGFILQGGSVSHESGAVSK